MQNDAKLGLLAGVLGVIVAGVVSADRPPQNAVGPGSPAPKQASKATPDAKPAPGAVGDAPEAVPTPGALPGDLDSTPVRTKKDADATPAGRTAKDDDLEP